MSKTAARYYALSMAFANMCVATLLTAMIALNALYNYPSFFVAIFAPLAALSFGLIACMWVVHAYSPEYRARRRQGSAAPWRRWRFAYLR